MGMPDSHSQLYLIGHYLRTFFLVVLVLISSEFSFSGENPENGSGTEPASTRWKQMDVDMSKTNSSKKDYFLVPSNPMATADQREAEDNAIKIVQTTTVKQAREVVAGFWRGLLADKLNTQREIDTFEKYIDEFVFDYAIRATGSDSNYPKIVRVDELGHKWFGVDVPGYRNGPNNPDTHYAMMPIDADANYVITGLIREPRAVDQTFNTMADPVPRMTLQAMQLKDLKISEDGTFKIYVGPKKPEGVENYFPTTRDVRYFYVRDTLGDWAKELPMEIRIDRIDPPARAPMTIDEMADWTARWAVYDVASMGFYPSVFSKLPLNMMTPANKTPGGLVSQLTSFGKLNFSDDEAVVITLSTGGSLYHSLVIHDFTLGVLDSRKAVISLNHAQADQNADGSYTYVISKVDPGVHNWLDSMDWNDVYGIVRWQGFPGDPLNNRPLIDTKRIKLQDLSKFLPKETRWLSKEERVKQIEQHIQEYLLRWSDR